MSLKELLDRENRGFAQLGTLLEQSRAAMTADPTSADAAIAQSWESALTVLEGLVAIRLAFDEPLTQEWRSVLIKEWRQIGRQRWEAALRSNAAPSEMQWFPGEYERAWWDYFPLQTFDYDSGTHILILNSVAPYLELLGSAWGHVGWAQMGRLGRLLESSSARHIVILVHHAPFRWDDEPAPGWGGKDLQRWACLGTDVSETREFVRMLEKTRRRVRKIVTFCGHRHGGAQQEPRVGEWVGGVIAEGASLADTPGAPLLCGWLGRKGRLVIGALDHTSGASTPEVIQ
jgi:hypothetical protein